MNDDDDLQREADSLLIKRLVLITSQQEDIIRVYTLGVAAPQYAERVNSPGYSLMFSCSQNSVSTPRK